MASGSTDLPSPRVSPVPAVPEEPGVPDNPLESEAVSGAPAPKRRRDSEDDTPPLDVGPWIRSSTKTSGNGASTALVQQQVGMWMGMITLVEVQDILFTVITDEDCYYLAIAMKHRALLGDCPMTVSEHKRIADL